jgi:signal transduction histidine kinase
MQNRDAANNPMTMRKLLFVGILTWALVAVAHLPSELVGSQHSLGERIGFVVCLFGFLLAFWIATREWCVGRAELTFIALQSILALGCIAFGPGGFVPILLVIIAGQLGHFPLRLGIPWIAVQSLFLVPFEKYEVITKVAAYFTFQLFGAFTARIANEERESKQALAAVNAELRVATGLLDISSRAEERVRIARELHDLLGHHLTALSLNLEVASHLTDGEAKEQIAKSQAVTKLLLSDVRESVSRLREDEPVDLAAAVRSIREAVPAPAIHVDADALGVTDPAVARTALRAVQEIVTNSVRHSGARNLWLTLRARDGTLAIDARDDGGGTDHVQLGNGLRGMRERVQQAGGTMDIASMRGRGFEVHITLPGRNP